MTERTLGTPPYTSAIMATVLTAVGAAVLLFARLGHYALWDDEALTAMTSSNVWTTHDTTIRWGDHNLMAYRNGLLVDHFRDRYTPPLQFFYIAPFIGLFGDSNFVCRLPMALCGVVTVALILLWLWRFAPPPLVWWMTAFAVLTNVSFFLFFRQCRYYGLATMLTTAAAYLYLNGRRRGSVAGLSAVLVLLLATQYLNYAAVIGCLVMDYLLWGRKTRPLKVADWMILILPQLLIGGIVCWIWNPVARQGGASAYGGSFLADRLNLFWWNWRDMFSCDFLIIPLVLICPLLYFARANGRPVLNRAWFLRAPAALLVYMAMVSTFVATKTAQAGNAEVRYLAPAAPLCIGVAVVAVCGIVALPQIIREVVVVLSVASIFLTPTPSPWGKVQAYRWPVGSSTPQWWMELIHPIDEPYTPLINWINTNVPAGSTVYIEPDYMAYPLMLRCPRVTFGWQLTDPPREDFVHEEPIQFHDRVAPDYLVMCGSELTTGKVLMAEAKFTRDGWEYKRVAKLPYYWKDLYRPELIWRSFETVKPFEDNSESLYILKRVKTGS